MKCSVLSRCYTIQQVQMQISSSSHSSGHRLANTNVCSDYSPDTLILPHFFAQPKMVWLVTWSCPVVKGIAIHQSSLSVNTPRCSSQSPWSSSADPFPPFPISKPTTNDQCSPIDSAFKIYLE